MKGFRSEVEVTGQLLHQTEVKTVLGTGAPFVTLSGTDPFSNNICFGEVTVSLWWLWPTGQ